MKDTTTYIPSTLEEIIQLRQQQLEEVRAQKQVLTEKSREIFTPLESSLTRGQAIMRTFNTGMTIFDGFMVGLKIMKKIKNIFRLKKA